MTAKVKKQFKKELAKFRKDFEKVMEKSRVKKGTYDYKLLELLYTTDMTNNKG